MAVDAGCTGPAGATNGAIGSGVTAFRTKVVTVPGTVTMAGAQGCTSPIQIYAVSSLGGVGVIRRPRRDRQRDATLEDYSTQRRRSQTRFGVADLTKPSGV